MASRLRISTLAAAAATAGLLPFATGAQAGITSIVAHSVTYTPGGVIPVVADATVQNSVVVKGQWMDLATGVESSDSSFTVKTGRRTGGSDTSLEILVGAGAASDLARSTIHIKFVSGQETFTIEA